MASGGPVRVNGSPGLAPGGEVDEFGILAKVDVYGVARVREIGGSVGRRQGVIRRPGVERTPLRLDVDGGSAVVVGDTLIDRKVSETAR